MSQRGRRKPIPRAGMANRKAAARLVEAQRREGQRSLGVMGRVESWESGSHRLVDCFSWEDSFQMTRSSFNSSFRIWMSYSWFACTAALERQRTLIWPRHETAIVFDWDDTILPTSWLERTSCRTAYTQFPYRNILR